MLDLKVLLKILYKPKEAFEELKEEGVNWQEGLIMWFMLSVISLLIFGAFSRALKSYTLDTIPIDFGFGTKFATFEIVLFFALALFGFVISSWLANLIARKLGGVGTFKETFAAFGYANVLTVVKAVAASIILTWMAFNLVFLANAFLGNEIPSIEFLKTLGVATFGISIVLMVWDVIIKGFAVSVIHEIKLWKSIALVLLLTFVLSSFNFAMIYLITYLQG